jgi:hypothetical protein
MRILLLGLALAALPATSEPRVTRVDPIAVYTQFLQQDPPPAVLEAIQDELAGIMTPVGLHLAWRSLAAADGRDVSVDIAVVTFHGGCAATDLALTSTVPGALGWTHITDGVILPFSEIDCDGIRRFLQADLLRLRQEEREAALGRAVGRVLAHELYHIFAKTRMHGAEGVGKRSYTARELLSPAFHFEERECEVLRDRTEKVRMDAAAMAGQ